VRLANITHQSHLCGPHQPCASGYLLAPCWHFTSFSPVTQVSSSQRWCCPHPNTNILHLLERPQQLLSACEGFCFGKSDHSIRAPLKIGCHPLRTHSGLWRGIVPAHKASKPEQTGCASVSALPYKQTLWHGLLFIGFTFHVTFISLTYKIVLQTEKVENRTLFY